MVSTQHDHMQEFYEISNKHRKLTWIYALGTCNLLAHFDQRTCDLVLTTFQATVLLLFNDGASLSFFRPIWHAAL